MARTGLTGSRLVPWPGASMRRGMAAAAAVVRQATFLTWQNARGFAREHGEPRTCCVH